MKIPMKTLLAALIVVANLAAQQILDLTNAQRTAPFRLSEFAPGVCHLGDFYVDSITGRLRACGTVPNTWVDAALTHNLLSATHLDTLASTPVLGGIMYANSTPAWAQLAGDTSNTRKFLRSVSSGGVATAAAWDTLQSGDIPGLAAAYIDWNAVSGGAFIQNKPSTFAPSAHASTHQNGGGDEVATATAAANAIPKAGSGGTLAPSWNSTVVVSASAALYAGTYTSGITATGTVGQTCVLGSLNGGGTAGAATVALTGTNAIAGSTALVITAAGSGYTSAPTSATASSGTATCSGTAVISTSLSITPTVAGFYYNNLASPVTYVLPAIAAGNIGGQFCFRDAASRSGALTLQSPASTFIDNAGTNGTAAATLVSTGAAGDVACLIAVSATQYVVDRKAGSWTNN